VAKGKDEAAARACLGQLTEAQRRQVRAHRVDMGAPFNAACKELLPNSQAVVDRFHVAKKFHEAVDGLRKKSPGGTRRGSGPAATPQPTTRCRGSGQTACPVTTALQRPPRTSQATAPRVARDTTTSQWPSRSGWPLGPTTSMASAATAASTFDR